MVPHFMAFHFLHLLLFIFIIYLWIIFIFFGELVYLSCFFSPFPIGFNFTLSAKGFVFINEQDWLQAGFLSIN